MQYTIFGKTGLRVSRLGFGCMRLPTKSKTEVDREKAIPMLHRAYELGINIYDSAVGYCAGDSQRVLGEAFEGIRDKIVLSTKNHHYDKDDKDTWWRYLEESLKSLRTDHIDIYNHHSLNQDIFEGSVAGEDGFCQDMLKAKEQGMIRHICFSFHGPNEQLVKLVDTGLFDTVILQYNLLDRHLEEGIAHAAASGMGVMVMGPVGGGRLGYPSEKVASLVGEVKSTPHLALRFVLSNKNVNVALSGMSTMQQLEENVETASSAGELTDEDHGKISAAVEERKKLVGLYCTGCNYCVPCPAGVGIPANFEILNLERVFGLTEHARECYAALGGTAALCTVCGKCLELCPQKIDIPGRLAEVLSTFDERAGKLAGWGELRGASLKEGVLRLKLRYILKNFSDGRRSARVQFLPHGEDQAWPAESEFKEIKPFGRKQEDIELAVRYPAEMYNLDVIVTHNGKELIEHLGEMVVAAVRVKGHSLDASRRRSGTVHVPSPLHPVNTSEDIPKGRSLDFAVSYDDENLYVFADVTDDLAEQGEGKQKSRCLRIYVDGRTPYMMGHTGGGNSVMQVTLHRPAEMGGEVKTQTSNKKEVRAIGERTGTGYRVDCAIPWSAFAEVPVPAGVIGFDIGIVSRDAVLGDALFPSWTGRPESQSRSSAFGKLVTV